MQYLLHIIIIIIISSNNFYFENLVPKPECSGQK